MHLITKRNTRRTGSVRKGRCIRIDLNDLEVIEDRQQLVRVRALMSNNDLLTAALQVHAVEARHAAHIRMIRGTRNSSTNAGTIKPWITGNASNILTGNFNADNALRANYQGEDTVTQSGFNLSAITNADAASEAFDEPLDRSTVLALIRPFIVV